MAEDTLTIAFEGDVSLPQFTEAMKRFQQLITALSREIVASGSVHWDIENLAAGSAIATIQGTAARPEQVVEVIQAYTLVGKAIERQEAIPFGQEVQKRAQRLTELIDNGITAIRFESPFGDALVSRGTDDAPAKGLTYAYGAVAGTVETLSLRRGLKFTLYDAVQDRPVSCYLDEDQSELIRDAWGRRVLVSGLIGREPDERRPVVIRDIRSLEIVETATPGSYQRARGILRPDATKEAPEVTIRRSRDEW